MRVIRISFDSSTHTQTCSVCWAPLLQDHYCQNVQRDSAFNLKFPSIHLIPSTDRETMIIYMRRWERLLFFPWDVPPCRWDFWSMCIWKAVQRLLVLLLYVFSLVLSMYGHQKDWDTWGHEELFANITLRQYRGQWQQHSAKKRMLKGQDIWKHRH